MERARLRPWRRRRPILVSPASICPRESSGPGLKLKYRLAQKLGQWAMAKLPNSLEVARLEIAEVGETSERYAGASSEKRPAVGALLVFDHKPPRVQPVDEGAVGRNCDHTSAELDEPRSRRTSDACGVLGQA